MCHQSQKVHKEMGGVKLSESTSNSHEQRYKNMFKGELSNWISVFDRSMLSTSDEDLKKNRVKFFLKKKKKNVAFKSCNDLQDEL